MFFTFPFLRTFFWQNNRPKQKSGPLPKINKVKNPVNVNHYKVQLRKIQTWNLRAKFTDEISRTLDKDGGLFDKEPWSWNQVMGQPIYNEHFNIYIYVRWHSIYTLLSDGTHSKF